MQASPERTNQHRETCGAWQEQLTTLHGVFLDDDRLDPPTLKGLLSREVQVKNRYDAMRFALLGIDSQAADAFG